MNNLYREHYIDASYQASVHWAMGFQSRRLKYEKLQTDDGSNDGNSSRCLWQGLLKSFDEYQGDNTNSNITSFFRFVDKRAIYQWYNLIRTRAGECDWIFHWQHKLCATLSANVNINYRLPVKVYYGICTLRHTRIEINHGSMNVFWVLTWVGGY